MSGRCDIGLRSITHGHCVNRNPSITYIAYCDMINRCYTPTASPYPYYGGRGIKVCAKWRGNFQAFLDDMGEKPSRDYTLERIDCNGDYEPCNCRWATKKEQARNRRSTRWVTVRGERMSLAEAIERFSTEEFPVVWSRLSRKWPIEQALGIEQRIGRRLREKDRLKGTARSRNKWTAKLKGKHLGTFCTEKEAHAAYLAAKAGLEP